MGLCPKPRDLTLWPNPGAAAGPDGTAVRWPGLRTCTALGLRPRIALSSVRHRTTYHDPGIAGRSVYTKSLTPPSGLPCVYLCTAQGDYHNPAAGSGTYRLRSGRNPIST